MSRFIPGKIIKEFTTKSGKHGVIRYPRWEDLDAMTTLANALSKEDTYLSFSGEELSHTEEAGYLGSLFTAMELGNVVKLFCEVEGKLVGLADVRRQLDRRERSKHVGIFGLMVDAQYRGEGIGRELAQTTIEESKRSLSGLRIIWLHVFANNEIARNLYQKLGFVLVGNIPEELLYKGKYIDGEQMILKLT